VTAQAGEPAAAVQVSSVAPAQEHQGASHAAGGEEKKVDIILPHISDSDELDVPWPNAAGFKAVHLPRWKPVMIGGYALDLSPTKHVVMMILAAILACIVLIGAARAHVRHTAAGRAPKGLSGTIEAMVLYIRNEVIMPNVGPHGQRFVPYLLSVFFFILFANLLGLLPYGSTATGNISVTAVLAIMTPVEILGKFTKPFALCIRLFANMTAGHVMVLALISIIFTFGSVLIGIAPVAMAVGIMVLELFVALLQAYVFTLLVSSFIGQIRTAEHH